MPGRTMADWLIDVGIDQPRTDRGATERVLLSHAPGSSTSAPPSGPSNHIIVRCGGGAADAGVAVRLTVGLRCDQLRLH